MDETLRVALNEQLTWERENVAFYTAIGATLDAMTWRGSSAWMLHQAQDEIDHARRINDYLIDRNAYPTYDTLADQLVTPEQPLVAYYQLSLEREQATTERIKTLYYLAEAQEDPQTKAFLHWFLLEQVEEERTLTDIVQELSRCDCAAAMLILDREYGKGD